VVLAVWQYRMRHGPARHTRQPVERLEPCVGRCMSMDERAANLWFGKKGGKVGFGPLNWQGRAASFLYAFLVVVAIVVYSQLMLTVLVVVFYSVIFFLVVAIKSDLMKGWPPQK